jgi:hypothetical protein
MLYEMTEMELFRCFYVEVKLNNKKVFLWKYLPRKMPKLVKPQPRLSVEYLRDFYARFGCMKISPFDVNSNLYKTQIVTTIRGYTNVQYT